MRVALVSFARRGGMLHFQAELANALGKLTPVLSIGLSDAGDEYYSKRVIRFQIRAGHGGLGSLQTALNPATWFRVARWLREARPDIIHIVAAHEWNPLFATISRAMGKPVIYTVHDPIAHAGAPVRMRISNWILLRMSDALVVLTRYGRGQLISQGFAAAKIHTIPHGIYSFLTKRLRGRKAQEDNILYFGRIEPYKGLENLVEAFQSVSTALPGWKLLIAGSGRLPSALLTQQTRQIEVVNRYLSDGEIADLLQRARIVVLPYREATQSGVVAAAYAFGRPVIVTRVGGLPEMVVSGKTGLVVPANDPRALARAMHRLARDPHRLRRMGREALRIGSTRWSWERVARAHMDMYSALMARGTSS